MKVTLYIKTNTEQVEGLTDRVKKTFPAAGVKVEQIVTDTENIDFAKLDNLSELLNAKPVHVLLTIDDAHISQAQHELLNGVAVQWRMTRREYHPDEIELGLKEDEE